MDIGIGDAEVFEEDVRHVGVVVLSGVNDDVLDVTGCGETLGNWAELDELWTCADDAEHLHKWGPFAKSPIEIRV